MFSPLERNSFKARVIMPRTITSPPKPQTLLISVVYQLNNSPPSPSMAQFRQSHERKNPNLQNFFSSKSLLVCCLHVVPGTSNPGAWLSSEEPQSKPLFPISNYATISGSWVITETRGLSHSSAYSLNSFCQSSSSSSSSSPWV